MQIATKTIWFFFGLFILQISACSKPDSTQGKNSDSPSGIIASANASSNKAPTLNDAKAFLADAEKRLVALNKIGAHAAWVSANFITYDTQALSAHFGKEGTLLGVELAQTARTFDQLDLPADMRRKLDSLKLGLTLPAPNDEQLAGELATLEASLSARYGKGQYCRTQQGKQECLSLGDMTQILAQSRDEQELKDIWQGWRQISVPMKSEYQRLVEIANAGAKDLGYQDLGYMWRSNYDMNPNEFATEMDRLWGQVKPLYEALHCHVRAKLGEVYGTQTVPQDQPIPAHLLGNMWAQTWGNLYEVVAPKNSDIGYDLTALIEQQGMDELEMVRVAERFFTSLGFDKLPETFWQRSLFTKPQDRDVVCHASAWDLDSQDDLRIKMCIQKTGEDFQTIHHELGHNFYQRAYKNQPVFFQASANDGFHEAIGDTIALSVTPRYLVDIGLLDSEPDASKDIGLLLSTALDKIAFLPFGLLVDQWRWKVFSGEVSPDQYNSAWWQLREKYQGIRPPVTRTEANFDPGAKYHIPGNTPYMRYFLSFIQQFQFHRALCQVAGHQGPLNRCSIYNNKEAGKVLNDVLEMGSSAPWPEAMKVLTGQSQMDASAIIDYFAPLKIWLDEQNKSRQCGW